MKKEAHAALVSSTSLFAPCVRVGLFFFFFNNAAMRDAVVERLQINFDHPRFLSLHVKYKCTNVFAFILHYKVAAAAGTGTCELSSRAPYPPSPRDKKRLPCLCGRNG